jgi:HNH endonuclease
MAVIKTKKGEEIMVDDDRFEDLVIYKWCLNQSGYAFNNKCGLMHRYLTNCPKGLTVDHINNNRADNRLENLEIVTQSENTTRRHERAWDRFQTEQWDKALGK